MASASPETVAMFSEVTDSVRKSFHKHGSVGCSFICETEDRERITFEAAGALGERAVAVKRLRKSFRRLKVARYVCVTECSTDAVDAATHPWQNPNCGKGVMVLAVDSSSIPICSRAEIKRAADGKETLGPWEPIALSGGWRSCLIKVRRTARIDGA
jgi:hypothetical protein